MTKPLAVIILNWNNYEDTAECIESVFHSQYPETHVVLVDNGSTDDSFEKLKKRFRDQECLHFIRNSANEGFAKGANVGIKYAEFLHAGYYLLLNNDAVLPSGCIPEMVAAAESDQRVGIVAPAIVYFSKPDVVWTGGGYFRAYKAGLSVPHKNMRVDKISSDTVQVGYLSGCVLLIRSEVFASVGLFDPDFFFYSEDVDFSLRVVKSGFKALYLPSSKALHKIEDIAEDRTSPFCMYHIGRSSLMVCYKDFSILYFFYALLFHIVIITPYRVWQIRKAHDPWASLQAWIGGIVSMLRDIPRISRHIDFRGHV